jgi:hypothetical protein
MFPFDIGLRLHRLMPTAELRAGFSRSSMMLSRMSLSPTARRNRWAAFAS